MANPIRNEEELFKQIQEQKITVTDDIWDILYHKIGDAVSAINLLCQYYYISNEPIPVKEAEKILGHTEVIRELIHGIFTSSTENFPFPDIKENIPLHPIIIQLSTHHINNDTNSINMIVGFYTDPDFSKPIPIEDIQKILDHTRMIKEFLEKLRQVTFKEGSKRG